MLRIANTAIPEVNLCCFGGGLIVDVDLGVKTQRLIPELGKFEVFERGQIFSTII